VYTVLGLKTCSFKVIARLENSGGFGDNPSPEAFCACRRTSRRAGRGRVGATISAAPRPWAATAYSLLDAAHRLLGRRVVAHTGV